MTWLLIVVAMLDIHTIPVAGQKQVETFAECIQLGHEAMLAAHIDGARARYRCVDLGAQDADLVGQRAAKDMMDEIVRERAGGREEVSL